MDGVFRYYMDKYRDKEMGVEFYTVPILDGSASIDNWFNYMKKHGFSIYENWLLREFWIMPTEVYQRWRKRVSNGNSNDRQLK